MYGVDSDDGDIRQFATNCSLARAHQRGVRFVPAMDASWDHHSELNKQLRSG